MLTILKLDSFYRKWGIIMGKYFGTDGVRGVAGADLTCELAMKIGRGAQRCSPAAPATAPAS